MNTRRSARRSCRCDQHAVYEYCLQHLPQPPLPEVPGRRGAPVDGGARGRTAPDPLLPRRLHATAAIGDIAYQNKAVIYDLLFKASSETHTHDRGRPEAPRCPHRHHVGAAHLGLGNDPSSPRAHDRAGRWALQDDSRWISCRPNFLLPVRVLSKLFRRLMLEKLLAAHAAGSLRFLGSHAHLVDVKAFAALLAPLARNAGSSTPSARSRARRPCSPICRATPTASPSRTAD